MDFSFCYIGQVALFLFWTLASIAAVIAFSNLPFTLNFKRAVLLSAARGKTWTGTDNSLSFISSWSVPQFYFWHFYAVGCLSTTLVLGGATISKKPNAMLLCLLFGFHVARRLLETLFLFKYPPKAKMHVIAYLFGLSYYVVVPSSFCSWILCQPNFIPNFQNLSVNLSLGVRQLFSLTDFCLIGIVFFLVGTGIQGHSHILLAMLKQKSNSKCEEIREQYVIPRGGHFKWVSCPHYFGEIIIYIGFTIISQGQPLVFLMTLWVLLNLMLGGKEMHQWYLRHCPNYPKQRMAVLPFLY